MGQRHQLFVIARVSGNYRSLAAVHHQWLYGHTALRRCRGTLKLFEHPGNRVPLERELIAAARYQENFWGASSDSDADEVSQAVKHSEKVPFPLIMTCLMLGASFDADDGYIDDVLIEPFDMKYDEGYNNNGMYFSMHTQPSSCCRRYVELTCDLGITIFDITDLSNVSYCFVDFQGMESEREVQLMTPLSARTYLEAYYDLSDPELKDDLVPLVQSFQNRTLIPTAVLEDAWPNEGWEEPNDAKDVEAMNERILNFQELHVGQKRDEFSLRHLAMDKLAQSLLDDPGNGLPALSEAELLSDFLPRLRTKVYERAATLEPSPAYMELLFETLKNDVCVDMSRFQRFSAKDLAATISRLTTDGKIRALDLSNMLDLNHQDLQTILDASTTTVRSLCLLDCPQISINDLTALKNGCDLYHSTLYKRSITDSRTKLDDTGYYYRPLPRLDFTSQSLHSVVQLVWIGVQRSQLIHLANRRADGTTAWNTLTSDNKVPTRMSWFFNEGLQYKKFPLVDTPLPLARLITGFSHLMRWISAGSISGTHEFSTGAASCFSMPVTLPDGQSLAISPLSTELYLRNSDKHWGRQNQNYEEPNLNPGQWAIVLIHECCDCPSQEALDRIKSSRNDTSRPLKRLRYVFVSPSKDGFKVATVQDYLDSIIACTTSDTTLTVKETDSCKSLCEDLRQWWEDNFKPSESMSFYAESDVQDIVERLYLCRAEDNVPLEDR